MGPRPRRFSDQQRSIRWSSWPAQSGNPGSLLQLGLRVHVTLLSRGEERTERTMRSGPRGSLLRLLILILTATDQTMVVLAARHGGHHHPVQRRIHLPRAMEATKKFLCREPQSRAYNLRDLVHSMQPSESVNQPVYIVVKKCDSHSGCCVSPDLSCAPVQSLIYHEDMEVEVWSLLTNSTRKVWVRIEQHGRCSCEISSASERLREDTRPPNIQILWSSLRVLRSASRQKTVSISSLDLPCASIVDAGRRTAWNANWS